MSGRKRWTHLDQMVAELVGAALGERDIFGCTEEEAAADVHRFLYGDGTEARGLLSCLLREVHSYPQGPETRQQRRARERNEVKGRDT